MKYVWRGFCILIYCAGLHLFVEHKNEWLNAGFGLGLMFFSMNELFEPRKGDRSNA